MPVISLLPGLTSLLHCRLLCLLLQVVQRGDSYGQCCSFSATPSLSHLSSAAAWILHRLQEISNIYSFFFSDLGVSSFIFFFFSFLSLPSLQKQHRAALASSHKGHSCSPRPLPKLCYLNSIQSVGWFP